MSDECRVENATRPFIVLHAPVQFGRFTEGHVIRYREGSPNSGDVSHARIGERREPSLALVADSPEDRAVTRRARGKPETPPIPAPAKRRDESVTARLDVTPELLASMLLDDSERPTVRMPARPPFATPQDEELARRQKSTDVTVRRRMVIGPDGLPQMVDPDELEEATQVGTPPKSLLTRGGSPKKKAKR